jgi:hypothetical protein
MPLNCGPDEEVTTFAESEIHDLLDKERKKLDNASKNIEYLEKLALSSQQLRDGEVIAFNSVEELCGFTMELCATDKGKTEIPLRRTRELLAEYRARHSISRPDR